MCIFNKTNVYKISRKLFFKSIQFNDNVLLLNAVKTDFNRLKIIINGYHHQNYLVFLQTVKYNYKDYEYIIYTLCNQCAHYYYYKIIFSIISKYNYHISSNNIGNKRITTDININLLNKQIILTNNYNIFKLKEDIKIYKKINIVIIINLDTIDDIIFKINYL